MKKITIGFLLVILLLGNSALACSVAGPTPTAKEGVSAAELILHVQALEYVKQPEFTAEGDMLFTTGLAPSTVRFRVVEVVKGKYPSQEIVLNGYLTDHDDFNDQEVPYDFVRSGGRSGSCFANTYKKGGDFLLLLVHRLSDYERTASARSLYEFYYEQYKTLPNFQERAKNFEQLGLGRVSEYKGSVEQNTQLIEALRKPLKKSAESALRVYTPNFWALGPTNEQIRGNSDPWLLWVKNALK